MEVKELTNLIKIREYVVNSIGIPSIDRKTVNELNGILLLLDKKIINILTGKEFKEYIDYKNVQEAKENAVRVTSIYSGIKDKR